MTLPYDARVMQDTQVVPPDDSSIGIRDVARIMGYHPQWVYRMQRAGTLPFKPLTHPGKKLRFSRREVTQWAAGHRRSDSAA